MRLADPIHTKTTSLLDWFLTRSASSLHLLLPILNLICLIGGGVLMALIGYRLFAGITQAGMQGVDTFSYWNEAEHILRGRVNMTAGWPTECQLSRACANTHFEASRLTFDILNVLAMKMLGVNDFALRWLVGVAAVINVGFTYFLSYRICANALIALAAASVYAFNPTIFAYSGLELPHTYGATFLLAAAVVALPTMDAAVRPHVQLILAGFTGFFLGLAVLTHEDLIFAAVMFGALIVLMRSREQSFWSRSSLADILQVALSFSVGFVCGLALPMLVLEVSPAALVRDVFTRGRSIKEFTASMGDPFFSETAPRIFRNVTSDLLEMRLSAMTAVAIAAVPLGYAMFRTDGLRAALVLGAVALGYAILFLGMQAYVESNYAYMRIFIPATGLSIISTIAGLYLVARSLLAARVSSDIAAIVATILVAGASLIVLAGYHPAAHQRPSVSAPRQLYDALRQTVTPARRLLLPACSGIIFEYMGLASDAYFGESAISLLTHPAEKFDAFVHDHSIGYVFVPQAFAPTPILPNEMRRVFTVFYGADMPPNVERSLAGTLWPGWPGYAVWTQEACMFERQLLRQNLEERGSRMVAALSPWGDVYEVR